MRKRRKRRLKNSTKRHNFSNSSLFSNLISARSGVLVNWYSMKWIFVALMSVVFLFFSFRETADIDVAQSPDPKLKARALIVLQNKCNDCHRKKNKSVIFTKDNMNSKSRKIYKQVFVKKKMPKEDVVLTTSERKDLQLWLDSLNP